PHEVVRVRQRARLVHVVDAPDEPSLGVSPRAKVLRVNVADREHLVRASLRAAELGPQVEPPIAGCTEKPERALRHAFVLQLETVDHDGGMSSQPSFVRACGRNDVHLLVRCARESGNWPPRSTHWPSPRVDFRFEFSISSPPPPPRALSSCGPEFRMLRG